MGLCTLTNVLQCLTEIPSWYAFPSDPAAVKRQVDGSTPVHPKHQVLWNVHLSELVPVPRVNVLHPIRIRCTRG